MGILLDFQEAKEKLTAVRSVSTDSQMSDALETFAFSQMPKRERVAIILSNLLGGDAEEFLHCADELIPYADKDFAIPFKQETSI